MLLEAVKEGWSDEHTGEQGAHGFGMVELLFFAGVGVEAAQPVFFKRSQAAPPGTRSKAYGVFDVTGMGRELFSVHRVIFGPQCLDIGAGLGGDGFDFGQCEIAEFFLFEVETILFRDEAQECIVVFEGREQVGPGIVELGTRGVAEDVIHEKAVVAVVLDVDVKGIALGLVVLVVVGSGDGVFVGRSGFAMRTRGELCGKDEDIGFPFREAFALGLGKDGRDGGTFECTFGIGYRGA